MATNSPRPTLPTAGYPTTRLQQVGFAIVFLCPTVSLILVVLRMYSRIRTRQLWFDDAFMCAAMIIIIPETVATYMFAKTSYVGIHLHDVPPHDLTVPLRWNYLAQVFYAPVLSLVKSSALTFLLRLGCRKPGVRRAILCANGVNLAAMLAVTIATFLQCVPVSLNWDVAARLRLLMLPPPGNSGFDVAGQYHYCVHQGAFYLSASMVSIVTDLMVLALPFWIFLDLRLPARMKMAVLGVFLLGSIVTLVSIVRFYYFYTAFFRPPGPDPTYSIAYVVSTIEINLAVICACAPALRGLARDWFAHLSFFSFLSSSSSSSSNKWPAAALMRRRRKPTAPSSFSERSTFTSWSVRSTLQAGQASQLRRQLAAAAAAGEGGNGGRRMDHGESGDEEHPPPPPPPPLPFPLSHLRRGGGRGLGLVGESTGVCSPAPPIDDDGDGDEEMGSGAMRRGRWEKGILCRTDISIRYESSELPPILVDDFKGLRDGAIELYHATTKSIVDEDGGEVGVRRVGGDEDVEEALPELRSGSTLDVGMRTSMRLSRD